MGTLSLDCSGWYGAVENADCTIVLVAPAEQAARSPRCAAGSPAATPDGGGSPRGSLVELKRLPGHLLILKAASEWMRCRTSPEWTAAAVRWGAGHVVVQHPYMHGGLLDAHAPPTHRPARLFLCAPYKQVEQAPRAADCGARPLRPRARRMPMAHAACCGCQP